jgi:DNA/RNA endonuclease G (NUC1)
MRIRIRSAALGALTLAMMSCSDKGAVGPVLSAAPQLSSSGGELLGITALPPVRISEIHYDNTGTDAGEAIEVSGPAGTDISGWKIILYNGSNGATYEPTMTLSGTIPATCGERGVVVVNYPVNGIQNGSPDGIALVRPIEVGVEVVEFLSYEGPFTAVGGPADKIMSTDIGVREAGNEAVGKSLQRNGANGWSEPTDHTFGACNDADEPPPPPPPPAPELPATRLVEIHYDNAGTDAGEAIEIEGPAGRDVTGWSVVLYNGNGGLSYNTRSLTGSIPAMCDGRGVVVFTYLQDGIQNGSPDGIALVDATGTVVEFLSYEGTFTANDGPAAGMASTDISVSEPPSPIGHSLQRSAAGAWEAPKVATFGACNSGDRPPPPAPTITFSGRTASDPALPVGFQDQIFATVRDGNGTVVTTTITWSAETPGLASIDQNGVVTALDAGTAIVRATAADGITTATFSLATRVATASATAVYAGNAEFGEPADGDPTDDFIVRRAQYTSSYNRSRGTPNWVSYNLEVTHFGPEDRCDCFTFDPTLPADYQRYTTADYTGAGAFHGYGIDRGHLARSFDRTSGSLDNATTFYFTNIIPQAADNNQGPWSAMELYLGDLARLQDREVYIIAGVSGNKGTVKNEGKIVIPASVWKVAAILPRNHGLAQIHSWQDLDVVAVMMPNEAGIRNVPWQTYETTVDAIEAAVDYDLLALLPDQIEIAVESKTKPPIAATDGPYTSLEHEAVAMRATGSSDPDGDALTYEWTFGDGARASGFAVSHTYSRGGVYGVQLTVTDTRGLVTTAATTVAVLTPVQAIQDAIGLVDDLVAARRLERGEGKWLDNMLELAVKQVRKDNVIPAVNQLEHVLNRLDALVRSGSLRAADAEPLQKLVTRTIRSISS